MHDLIPAPRRLEGLGGGFDLGRGGRIAFQPGLEAEASLLAAWLEDALGAPFSPAAGAPSPGSGGAAPIRLSLDPGLGGAEEHVLSVAEAGVELRAGGAAGLVRGGATLRQLALSGGPVLPGLRVEDGPRFPWRGFMLDTARNFFPVDFLERLIDLAALHKLSVFHWHLTDDQAWRLDLPGRPELARQGSRRLDRRYNLPIWKEGSYSLEDCRRVVAYAAVRHITVVPEIESPGHAIALLASHPELSCRGAAPDGGAFYPEDRYGVFEEILCAGKEEVFELLAEVYDALAAVFPGPYVHAGGDEAPKTRWLACPSCRARMIAEGLRDPAGGPDPERLQAYFMGRVAELLAARGKRLVGWDEILEGGVGKDALVMSWRGYEGGIAAAKAGYEVVMSPQTRACYLDHKQADDPLEPGQLGVCTLEDSYAFEPIPPALSAEEGRRIIGAQANLWTELMYFGAQVEYMAFPRLAALSEVFWSPREGRDFADFSRRLEVHGARLDALGVNRRRPRLG